MSGDRRILHQEHCREPKTLVCFFLAESTSYEVAHHIISCDVAVPTGRRL